MHPNGQIPAYEWAFGDVNPPVQAWAAWRVYKIEQKRVGKGDRNFLERIFHKLLLNFTWWVNRKDPHGDNLFQGGFLGLDNIGVFDRSKPLPTGGYLEQADGTAWMGMFCLNMLAIALELARDDLVYADIALKFFEHFLYIADAIDRIGSENIALWDEADGFYYDALELPNDQERLMKVRSMVGLTPLGCDLVGYFSRNYRLFEVSFWNLFVAAIAIFVAVIFGQFEAGLAQVYEAVQPVLNLHTVIGWSLSAIVVAITAWRLVIRARNPRKVPTAYLGVATLLVCLVCLQVYLGSKLVWVYGLHVEPVVEAMRQGG